MSEEKKKNNNREKGSKDKNDNFIMLPTVDFCFKELMKNQKVRKGFIAAILGKQPNEIHSTTLIATELRKDSEDDKLGILDVLVELEDGSHMKRLVKKNIAAGKSLEEIAEFLGIDLSEVRALADEVN